LTGNSVALHAVAKRSGELALLGAIITRAVDDSRAGDVGATVWLCGPECLDILARIAPDGVDPRTLQQRLLIKVQES
jgi:hypothetical protein